MAPHKKPHDKLVVAKINTPKGAKLMEQDNTPKQAEAQTKPDVSEDAKTQEPKADEKPVDTQRSEATQAQGHTPDRELLAALKEERSKRKELEARLEKLENPTDSSDSDDAYFEESGEIKKELDALKERINKSEEQRELDTLYSQYPALKDKAEDFEEYRKDFPRHKLANAAKLFLSEKGLLETTQPERKGVEPAQGGPSTPPKSGLSADEIKNLRENNFQKYTQMLQEGKIRYDEIE